MVSSWVWERPCEMRALVKERLVPALEGSLGPILGVNLWFGKW